MIRQALLVLAVGAAVTAGGCSRGEAPRSTPSPEPVSSPPVTTVPVAVHVSVPEDPTPGIQAWARDLEAAVAAGHGQLALAETEEAALVVVRIRAVETGVKMTPEPPGEGEITVMRGSLVVGGTAREFSLGYRGEARPQAEALARHLRSVATEGRPEPGAEAPGSDPSS